MDQQDIPRPQGGRRTKGGRELIPVRPGKDLKAFYEDQARRLGVATGTWCIIQIHENLGLPLPEWVERDLEEARARQRQQEVELPLLSA